MTGLPIGEVSRRSGVKVPTIRYYEEVGLMPLPVRTDAGRRTYSDADVRHLRFIRHARELGFEVDAIRQLLGLSEQPDSSCSEVDVIARTHLAEIDRVTSVKMVENGLGLRWSSVRRPGVSGVVYRQV